MTLAELQAKREEILAEMGGPDVQYADVTGDRSIKRRSQADLEEALKRIDREIAGQQTPQARQFTIQTKRGIER